MNTRVVGSSELGISDPQKPLTLGYRPWLDGVRAIAIIGVLAVHTTHIFDWPVLMGGSLGVDLFFVLSGFLITSLLFEEWRDNKAISFRNFYARRFLRLVPALCLLLGALAIFSPFVLSQNEAADTTKALPIAFFYVSDFAIAFWNNHPLGALKHTWSLAIEEQFYVLWPPLLALLFRYARHRGCVLFAAIVGVAAVATFRAIYWIADPSVPRLYYSIDTRCDALLVGCVASMLVYFNPDFFHKRLAPHRALISLCALAFIAACFAFTDYASGVMYLGGFTVFAIAAAFLMGAELLTSQSRLAKALSHPILAWIGRISYGLYLWHYPVFKGVRYVRAPWWVQLMTAFALSFAIAFLSYFAFERPILRLKKHFLPKGRGDAASGPF